MNNMNKIIYKRYSSWYMINYLFMLDLWIVKYDKIKSIWWGPHLCYLVNLFWIGKFIFH